MTVTPRMLQIAIAALGMATMAATAPAAAQAKKPNIVVIMADDIGWSNVGVYNQGIMAGRTPNLDRMASEGMRFTDYYAEASCTAGRANFITGELPIRTGLTTVGQAGSPIGMPAAAPTIATALKSMGYATGPVRQEPPRRPQPIPAHGARVRRVLRVPLSSGRDGGPLPPQLSAGGQGDGGSAEHGPQLGHDDG